MARRLLLASFAIILLSTMAVPAVTSHWHMVTTSDFYILTDATEGKTRQAAIRLEQMHIIFGQLLSRNKIVTSEPLDVMVLRDEDYVNAARLALKARPVKGDFLFPAMTATSSCLMPTSPTDGAPSPAIRQHAAQL